MNDFEALMANISLIERRLSYSFKNNKLLILAFLHRSFMNENKELVHEYNERLEFLGDSVLGLIVAEYLYLKYPENPEGDLSLMRSKLVEATSCVHYLQKLEVEQFVLLGKGEKMNHLSRGRTSILADLFEAIIGAIFLDGGLKAAKAFFYHHFTLDMESILKKPLRNYKAELQDYSQRTHQKIPMYKVLEESGPDHSKTFHISVFVEETELGSGVGACKKEAQQNAAASALKQLLENKAKA